MFDIERLDGILDEGCPACPWPYEPGVHYWALDGNFRLFRYRNSSKELFKSRLNQVFSDLTASQMEEVMYLVYVRG